MVTARERIVILEDDLGLRTSLCEALLEEGYTVTGAGTAGEAVTAAEESGFDLIVADIRMAGMDGLEAVAAVRRCLPQIRVIVMTGYSSDADSIRALRLGVHDYLRKPFELEDFLAAVQRQVASHRNEFKLQLVEQSARSLVVWTLEGLLQQSVKGIGRLTEQVALHLGLSPAQAQESQILALAEFLRSSGHVLDFALLNDSLRLSCRAWLHQVEPEEGESLVLRVARASLERMQNFVVRDTELSRIFSQVARNPLGQPSPKVWKRRSSLLALAQACERSDPGEARRIYRMLIEEASPSQETLMAYLGVVRLEPSLLHGVIQPALALARQVGPLAFAQTSLALALAKKGPDGAALLPAAERIFTQLSDLNGAARVRLAAQVLNHRLCLSDLMEFESVASAADWQACCAWLLPQLAHQSEAAPFLKRLLKSSGTAAVSHILALPAEQRHQLIACVQEQPVIAKAWEEQETEACLKSALQGLRAPSAPPGVELRIYTLGPIQIFFGEELLSDSAWTNRKHLLLLLYLAAFPGKQSEEVLIDRLWPGKDAASGRNNLNSALSNLRKVFKLNGVEAALLQRDRLGIWLDSGLRWHDLDEFERCLNSAREAGEEAARQQFLQAACRLSRGTFMDGQYYDWSEALRQQHEKKLTEALLALSEICLSREHYLEALEHSHRLLSTDPCCQKACLAAMRSYLALSRAEDAVRLYERTRRSLQEELGIEPSTALIEMRERALIMG